MNPKIKEFLETRKGQTIGDHASLLHNWLGGVIVDVEEDTVRFEFEAREDLLNPLGIIHGGILALIMDEMMGALVYFMGYGPHVALNLHVEFLRKVNKNEKIIAQPSIVKKGKNIVFAACEIYNSQQQLIAKASSNLLAL